MNDGAWESQWATSITMAGRTFTYQISVRIVSIITITTGRLPTSPKLPARRSGDGRPAQRGATTITMAILIYLFRGTRSSIKIAIRSEEHTSELQSPDHLVCRLLLEKKKKNTKLVRMEKQ